ncbi:CRP/FNR family transcriptional regulator, cyclic AMP receptor protein [Acinetobacter boissieri]|uniref:CRP/FNR family transcriptional regulator, cyclic AMP receptor protein n=2 Tax=Acinetobacter boissieri TaxID=1219383 RepID=A0A1G6GRY5_9GAMM|nr:CRP/FNR family transcriptional regulator, cyclic AMP receptor protein [Acinetobacter boissieri]
MVWAYFIELFHQVLNLLTPPLTTASGIGIMPANFFPFANEILSPNQLPESVKALLKRAYINRHPKRTTLIESGKESKSLYLILKGSVSVILREDDEREIVVAYLNAGEFFGEMGLFETEPHRTAEVRTRETCEIAEISYENFLELAVQYPDLNYAIFSQLTKRLKNTTRKMTDLAFIDVTGRIARCLIDLAHQPAAMLLSNGRQIRITRQEIGRIVGCSREMVGRVLKSLEEQGMIETEGKAILIYDAALECSTEK